MVSGGAQFHVSMLLCRRRVVTTADGRREFILPHGPIRLHRQVPVNARGRSCADPRGSSSARGRIHRRVVVGRLESACRKAAGRERPEGVEAVSKLKKCPPRRFDSMRFEPTKLYEIERTWLKMHRTKWASRVFITSAASCRTLAGLDRRGPRRN